MKNFQVTINIKFADSISGTDEDIQEMTAKIAGALKHECDSGMGIAPESSETYTTEIQVIPTFLPDAEVTIKL